MVIFEKVKQDSTVFRSDPSISEYVSGGLVEYVNYLGCHSCSQNGEPILHNYHKVMKKIRYIILLLMFKMS
jgi:hypothetical protein